MMLAFILTMPCAKSWNGKWSGEDRLHCVIRPFVGAKQGAKAQKIIAASPYWYSWDDGWGAQIHVREVDRKEAARMKKKSAGFAGYDWMIRTIIEYGKPLADHEIPKVTV